MGVPPPMLPAWVKSTPDEVHECDQTARESIGRELGGPREHGVVATTAWVLLNDPAPMTWRTEEQTRRIARAESWLALCIAAGQPGPLLADWRQLGAEPLPAQNRDGRFAYGVWRTLAWLMGVREEWPVYSSWHRRAGMPQPDPHLEIPAAQRDFARWWIAHRAARERDDADALHHWRHTRRRLDRNRNRT